MRAMAEAVELRARVYIHAHKNEVWENRDKLRRRHAALLQDQSSGFCLAPRRPVEAGDPVFFAAGVPLRTGGHVLGRISTGFEV